MITRLRAAAHNLGSTFWFIPLVIVAGCAIVAAVLVEVSAHVNGEVLTRWPRIFGASALSSRGMLATIAGSMITVAGVTFSITMVAVTQASAQYTPRILRNFMRDRPSQVVLGGLVGVFTYCLVVLRTIRGGDDGQGGFVPSLAVLTGFLLAGFGIALLIFFMHHIAESLQAASIVARVARDTTAAIDRMFPAEVGTPEPDGPTADERDWLAGRRWTVVRATQTGYVQHIDADRLLAVARRLDAVIRMEYAIGDFVIEGSGLLSITGTEHVDVSDDTARQIEAAYRIGVHRTVDQDATFGLRQLSDIAVKALSPGVNDPTTAITCIHQIAAVLAHAARRREESGWRRAGGRLRLIARVVRFDSLMDEGLDAVRHYGQSDPRILLCLADALGSLAELSGEGRREHLSRHASRIATAASRSLTDGVDREVVRLRIADLDLLHATGLPPQA